eukprot:m.110653 g.110653  ORF g.110653 m.110653 type:complete len:805 (+) comp16065_c1_seq2:49-2463(+)
MYAPNQDTTSLGGISATSSAPARPDFILIAEFCEIDGPKPVCTIPKYVPNFDADAFVLRVMAVDYQAQVAGSGQFRIAEDSEVVLTEPAINAYAYVHNFTLYDLHARGFVRPFSIVYVTSDPDKIMDHFADLSYDFTKVASYLKYGNRTEFYKELQERLADLQLTQEMLTSAEKPTPPAADNNVEETKLQTCRRLLSETQVIADIIRPSLRLCREAKIRRRHKEETETRARLRRLKQTSVTPLRPSGSSSPPIRRSASVYSETKMRSDSFNFVTPMTSSDAMTEPSSPAADDSEYTAKFVHVNKLRDFARQLKALPVLCGVLYDFVMQRLIGIIEYYSRDLMVLSTEEDEVSLLAHPLFLLTLGRTVVLNFYQPVPSSGSETFKTLLGVSPGRPSRRRRLFGDQPAATDDTETVHSDSGDFSDAKSMDSSEYEWFEPNHLRSPSQESLTDMVDDDDYRSVAVRDMDVESYRSVQSVDTTDVGLRVPTLLKRNVRGGFVPSELDALSQHSEAESCEGEVFLSPPESQRPRAPFQSSADFVSHPSQRKPGKGLLDLVYNYTFVDHLLYSLLSGRTVLVLGSAENEAIVRNMVRSLWLFVPGHSKYEQVIPWRANAVLKLEDLASVKLIGSSKELYSRYRLAKAVDNSITTFDLERGTLTGPKYKGSFVHQLVEARNKVWSSEEVLLANVQAVFLEIASKAYVYFHVHCLRTQATVEDGRSTSSKEFLASYDVHDGDAYIVEYFAAVVQRLHETHYEQLTCIDGTDRNHAAPAIRLDMRPAVTFRNKLRPRSRTLESLFHPSRSGDY